MNLSYTLIREWLYCPFRMKIEKFDRVQMPEAPHMVRAKILGRLVHAGQAEALRWPPCRTEMYLGQPGYPKRFETLIRRAVADEMDRNRMFLGCLPKTREHAELLSRVVRMVRRWERFYNPHVKFKSLTATPWAIEGGAKVTAGGLIETRFIAPLVQGIGIFDRYVCAPDWVCSGLTTDHPSIIDWKWRSKLTPDADEPERFNVQAAFYQKLLMQLGLKVFNTITVEGLREEPTVPVLTKSGSMNRSPIRCSWEEYELHVKKAGLDPDDYQDMREKCLPSFRVHSTFRSDTEVNGVWNDVIAPVANLISRTLGCGLAFPRVMDPDKCGRCHLREACTAGLVKRAHHPAFNSPVRFGP